MIFLFPEKKQDIMFKKMPKQYRFLVFIFLIIAFSLEAQVQNAGTEPSRSVGPDFARTGALSTGNDTKEISSNIINEIVISGLKRTKKHVVEKPLKKYIGQDASKVDLNDVRAAIVETGILEPLSIEIEDDFQKDGKILKVEVHEKWSIFPIPIFFANSSGIGGGLGFIDFNALGINDKFMVCGMVDFEGWLAATMYIHTPGMDSSLGWNIFSFYSKKEKSDADEKNNDIRKFGLKRLFVLTGLNYQISEPLIAMLNLSFIDANAYDIKNSLAVPEDNGTMININPKIRIFKNNWDGYFLSQRSIEIGYTYSFGIDSPSYQKIELQTNFEKSLVPGFRMFVRAGMIYAPDTPPLFESDPGDVKIDILPNSFAAKNLYGGSAGLEKCLFKNSYGTISILSSYQIVYSDGPILGERIDHGVLGSMRFYLKKIAFPAVGFGVSYNVAAKYLQGALNAGMNF